MFKSASSDIKDYFEANKLPHKINACLIFGALFTTAPELTARRIK